MPEIKNKIIYKLNIAYTDLKGTSRKKEIKLNTTKSKNLIDVVYFHLSKIKTHKKIFWGVYDSNNTCLINEEFI